MADNAELAKRNTRLIEESEALLMRCQATDDAQQQPSIKKNKKGLFPFGRYVLLTCRHLLLLHMQQHDSWADMAMSMPS